METSTIRSTGVHGPSLFSLLFFPRYILRDTFFHSLPIAYTLRNMATKRRAAVRPEFSIVGDEQERHRIQLEHNLQNKDLSIDLLSSHGDYSLEYARHAERSRSPFSHRSYGHHDHSVEEQSQVNPWSYRTADDDDENGVNPYAGESHSTVAHHASVVTLNAGLGPRRGDDTRSGAEFDPERPLQNIMAGAERLSMFGNNTTSKSIRNVYLFSHCPTVSLIRRPADRSPYVRSPCDRRHRPPGSGAKHWPRSTSRPQRQPQIPPRLFFVVVLRFSSTINPQAKTLGWFETGNLLS